MPLPLVRRWMLHVACCIFFLVLVVGCSKSEPTATGSRTATQPSNSVARLHWLGKKRLAAENNATNFMALWRLPESARLETQTLDKLSTAPWRLLKTAIPLSNAPVALLRPLLDDLVQEESYLEVHGATNQPGALVFAIRLDGARARLWQTNLTAVLESITGNRIGSDQPTTFKLQASTFNFQLGRSGDWTLLGVAVGSNPLLGEFISRIQRDHAPFPAQTTNYWVEVAANLQQIRAAFALDWPLPDNTPQFNFTMIGEGETVHTRGDLSFLKPCLIPPEPWNIPTNLIGKSLTSFTAVRGLLPWLENARSYDELRIGPVPNQLFVWSLPAFPMQSFLAIPSGNAANRYLLLRQRLLTAGNGWLATNSVGQWAEMEGDTGLQWQGAPFMTPFVRPVTTANGDFLTIGLVPTPLTNITGNLELSARVLARTNAVYYDWELTGPRIESWFYMGQLARVIFGRGQISPDSAVAVWLKALQSKLSNSGTVVTMTDPNHLSLERVSSFGYTAFELHLFADWIESLDFPRGLHTAQVAMKRKLSAMPSGAPAAPAKP